MNKPIGKYSCHVLMVLPQDLVPVCASLVTLWYIGKYLRRGRNTPWLPAVIAANVGWLTYYHLASSLDYGLYFLTLLAWLVSTLVG